MPEKLMSAEELAEVLGIPLATVYNWNATGKGPPRCKVGRYVRYRPSAVDRWLDEAENAAESFHHDTSVGRAAAAKRRRVAAS